jgi:alpha-ketoglutaric semialdehyde dehydrogenase
MKLLSIIGEDRVEGDGPEISDENPSRPRETVATYREVNGDGVDRACEAAAAASMSWRATPMHERAAILVRAARDLHARAAELGRELSEEEGKLLLEGVGEVTRAARILEYYAAEADRAVGELFASPRRGEQLLTKQVPVGPTSIITPWNFPIAIPAWKLAPALIYGNPVVWKPSPVAPKLAVRLAEALLEAGLPAGVLNLVLGGAKAGRRLLTHPAIRACSFTGSTPVGRAVLAIGTEHGVKVQAEMGGRNVAAVLADADLQLAADRITAGATGSTGQKCTATSRVVVDRQVQDHLVDLLRERFASLRRGDPLEEGTDLGPLGTRPQLKAIRDALASVRAAGGDILLDGEPAPDPDEGYFVRPSLVTGLAPEHPVCSEEIFGPFVTLAAVDGTDAVFEEADRGELGLTASVFTTDLQTALAATERLEVGVLHVNSETTGAEPHVPFGGVKSSGAGGREMGRAAREFYTETRTVYLA